jgi:glycosyltransferase 2 family protein
MAERVSPETNSTEQPDGTSPVVSSGGWLHAWIGLAVSVACVVLTLRGVRIADVIGALRRADIVLVLVAALSTEVTILVKAARWRTLFRLRTSVSVWRTFSILSIGLVVNAFAPARLGELVRAYMIGEAEADSKTFALGTIGVEKVLDLLALVVSLAVLFYWIPLPGWLVAPARVTSVTLVIAVVLVVLLDWKNELAVGWAQWMHRLIPAVPREWLERQVRHGLASLSVIRHPRLLAELLAWTAVVWLLSVATNLIMLEAMGLSVSLWSSVLLLAVLQVGVAVPSSPGKIGVFHYLTVLTLSIFQVPRDAALGYAVVLHLVVYVPIALAGAWCVWREGVPWQRMLQAASRVYRSTERPA